MSKLALLGGKPVRTQPFSAWPVFDAAEEELLLKVLRSRNWGGYPAPNVHTRAFGEAFAKATDAGYGILCANGSITLELALRAGGIQAGDEVIVPTYTWLATAGAAVYVNAVPVFVDVTPDDYTLDPALVEAAITDKTRAVIAVHLASSAADIDRLKAICAKHKLLFIEDCAHAHGGKWNGRGLGSHGDFGSFSFQSSKLMTSGEGGLVTTNDLALADRVQAIVNCGRKEPGYDHFEGEVFGNNYRATEFQAAVLLAQLKKLPALTKRRAQNAETFLNGLAEIPGLTPLKHDPRLTTPAHYQVVVKYDPQGFKGLHRDRFLKALLAEGIEADGDFYEPIQERPLFRPPLASFPQLKKRYPKGIHAGVAHTPVAHKAAYEEAIWLHYPHFSGTKKDVTDILNAMRKIHDHVDELL